ncbi:hypothetical protein GGX14DRAFT_602830 [Mycena pura]|uniref:Uncharacterized protein n=1 Tax=Mycena pura TaxID=153505 RepID=A0AAD6YFP3_9AGAR|nr:hypothetical protein GGX14DRAFT_602830 [Mycena pura]
MPSVPVRHITPQTLASKNSMVPNFANSWDVCPIATFPPSPISGPASFMRISKLKVPASNMAYHGAFSGKTYHDIVHMSFDSKRVARLCPVPASVCPVADPSTAAAPARSRASQGGAGADTSRMPSAHPGPLARPVFLVHLCPWVFTASVCTACHPPQCVYQQRLPCPRVLRIPQFPATPSVSFPTNVACSVGLAAHDCVVSIVIGALLWLAHTSFSGIPLTLTLALSPPLAAALRLPAAARDMYAYRSTARLGCHPQSVGDCPCFEDAIAIGSVALGILLSRWGRNMANMELNISVLWSAHAPGLGADAEWVGADAEWVGAGRVPRTSMDVGVWWSAVSKMVFACILAIFVWRRDYTRVPPLDASRPIPSVINLPVTAGVAAPSSAAPVSLSGALGRNVVASY